MEYLLGLLTLLGFGLATYLFKQLKEKNAEGVTLLKENLELQNKAVELSAQLQSEKDKAEVVVASLRREIEMEKTYTAETKALLNKSKEELSIAFKAASSEALSQSAKEFLSLAEQNLSKWQQQAKGDLTLKHKEVESLIDPIKESLSKLDSKLALVEKDRTASASSLEEQIKSLNGVQDSLRRETSSLVKALRIPNVRGRWGELQLKKVVELSGMTEHCDFEQQVSVDTDDGKLRPDMIINLPNHKTLVVDSKVPLASYIDSLEVIDDEVRISKLKDHARQVKAHINTLALKSYWEQFDSPEFVIMFLPGEMFFNAAMEHDPDLLEYALQRNIILTTPTSFMAVLKSVALGWQQEAMSANSRKISELGTELYDRVRTFTNNFVDVKKGLDKAVEAYNKSVSSLESRVLVTARKLTELGVSSNEIIVEVEPVEKIAKLPNLVDSNKP